MIDQPFAATAVDDPAGVRMQLAGRLDREAEDRLLALWSRLADDGATRVVLDFGESSYINSSGLAAIVALLADARGRGIPVAARGLSAHYRHLFEITRLSELVEIEPPTDTTPEPQGVS